MSWISGFMKPSALFSSPATDPVPSPQTTFKQDKAAILVTQELEKAIAECKKKVASIAKSCRAKNRRFRDPEFDLERDKDRCLHGLSGNQYRPSDVRRVNEIFDDPQFYIDGVSSSDLVQGAIGDCWFISALATASCAPGLVEKFCVARDEQIGVYGFIFFRDAAWVTVIIDDLLYSSIPKYEELSFAEKSLYHNNKDIYNKTARRGGKSLLFARSGTENETWVPLIEKAYAKLHGDYYALSGGLSHEAIEDMTGGIAGLIRTQDILDIDRFWNEELTNANQGRLFGCSFENMQTDRLEFPFPQTVKGLIGNHDYSVLRAVEFKGKRFVVIRNPWGESEWTGPWSDGSKEWTKETLEALSILGHEFGDDGQFVMEYRDFLASWDHVHRTLLFDSSWVMSSHWLRVPVRPFPSNLEYGDVSFTINIPKVTRTVIVLSRLDDRYFRDLAGSSNWAFNFILYKKGDPEEISESQKLYFGLRSVNIEVELDAGDYVVHIRLDRTFSKSTIDREDWDKRKLALVLAERAKSRSIAANFDSKVHGNNIPIPISILAGQDLATLEKKIPVTGDKKPSPTENPKTETQAKVEGDQKKEAEPKTSTDAKVEADSKKEIESKSEAEQKVTSDSKQESESKEVIDKKVEAESTEGAETKQEKIVDEKSAPASQPTDKATLEALSPEARDSDKDKDTSDEDRDKDKEEDAKKTEEATVETTTEDPFDTKDDDDSIYLGLRVYTDRSAPAVLAGQLRDPEKDLRSLISLNL